MGSTLRPAAAAVALTLVLILALASLLTNEVELNLLSSSPSTTSERAIVGDRSTIGGGRAADQLTDSGSHRTSGHAGNGQLAAGAGTANRFGGVGGVSVVVGGGGGVGGAKEVGAPRWKGSGKRAYAVCEDKRCAENGQGCRRIGGTKP